MLYLTMAEKTSVGGCHVMLMNLGPALVIITSVGYAVVSKEIASITIILIIIMKQSLGSYLTRERQKLPWACWDTQ